MSKIIIPNTPAISVLRNANINFLPYFYKYVERGGTRHAAKSIGVDEHLVIKTIVMEAISKNKAIDPLVILMHGDLEVSTEKFSSLLQVSSIKTASPAAVEKYTGYIPGGVCPFGTRFSLPIYVEETILLLDRVYLNGGIRGFIIEITPSIFKSFLSAIPVKIGNPKK